MAAGHSPKERNLLTDIRLKNTARRELERLVVLSRRYEAVLARSVKKSRNARLGKTLERYEAKITNLRKDVLRRNEGLKPRIIEELKVSEQEVRDFQAKYRKELEETKTVEQELAEARKQKTSKVIPMEVILRKVARLEKKIGREKKEDQAAKAEITSEEADKIILNHELQRIAAELTHYGS